MGIPHVVSIKETNEVIYYDVVKYANDYFTLNIISDGDMRWAVNHYQVSKTISYSKDNGTTWIDISSTIEGASIPVVTGDVVIFKGDNSSYFERGMSCHFKGTAKFNASGNVMSLIYGDDFVGKYEFTDSYCLHGLFEYSNIVNAENLVLPATTLTEGCYHSMFYGCKLLVNVPELPVTTLVKKCYQNMFGGCNLLTTTPELPVTTLAEDCYRGMFYGCTSLTKAPTLPATKLAVSCYSGMFNGCTSLETAPELPATKLEYTCYTNMFSGCTNLYNLTKSEFIAFNKTNSGFNGTLKDCYIPKTQNVIINLSNTDEVIFNYSDGVYSALRKETILTDVLSEEVINTLTPEYNLTVTVYGNYPDAHIVKTITLCEHITWEAGQSLKEFSEKFGFNFKDSSISILYTSRNGGDYYYYYD